MSDDRPTPMRRRDLMKPSQLIGLSLAAALFAGLITLMAMGFFEDREAAFRLRIVDIALIAAGCTFIGTAICIALLLLMIQPAEVTQVVDKPTLVQDDIVIAELKAQRAATDAAKAAARAQRHGTPHGGGSGDAAPHA